MQIRVRLFARYRELAGRGEMEVDMAEGGDRLQITDEPILPEKVISQVRGAEYGAVVAYVGTVRGRAQGKQVLYLEFETNREIAQRMLQQIAQEIEQRWGLKDVAIWHRVGRMEVGEAPVVIAVGAPHRREAFAACRYAIDRFKQTFSVWKKEVFADGEVWVDEQRRSRAKTKKKQ